MAKRNVADKAVYMNQIWLKKRNSEFPYMILSDEAIIMEDGDKTATLALESGVLEIEGNVRVNGTLEYQK